MSLLSRITCIFAFISQVAAGAEREAPQRETLVFEHVTVVDVANGSLLADRSVVVANGRIASVRMAGEAPTPAGAKVVDATGKYAIPGLWDMHVHFAIKSYGALFVANGVTGVRVMWGNPPDDGKLLPADFHFRWRDEFDAGKAIGPRMVIASGLVDGPNPIWPGSVVVRNAAEGRQAVRAAKKAGSDFVKVYSLIPADAYFAIAEECKTLGIPFAGHIPMVVTAGQASDAGQRTMEHLYGLPYACSSREDELVKRRAEFLKSAKGYDAIKANADAMAEIARSSYSEEKAQKLFAKLKKNGTWQCPTLTVLRSIAWLDDARFVDDPRLKYTPPAVKDFWDPKKDFRLKSKTPADYARMKEEFKESVETVKKLNSAGVGILAGTDELNQFCFPGFSLHDELALLVQAGLTPLESLQSATINPARYLGRTGRMGTIEAGKDADLILLDANPLVDIHNTAKIRSVIAGGRLYDRAALDRILTDAEQHVPEK
jgi:imidazolonepropionase-like amidohydrolase